MAKYISCSLICWVDSLECLVRGCEALKSEGPLIIHQPVEIMWISCNPISHRCVPFIGAHSLVKQDRDPFARGAFPQEPT